MIKKFLQKIQRLIDALLDESPGATSIQQKITVVGNSNTIIIDGNHIPNSIVTKNKSNVKHFPQRK